MEKHSLVRACKVLIILPYFTLCFFSCVNSVSEDNPDSGSVPITLSTSIQTRVLDNKFEDNDLIGVFLLSSNQAFSSDRHLDNVSFSPKTGAPASGKAVYYPKWSDTYSLYSYYPYMQNGVAPGFNKMTVSVSTDQQSDESFSHSDFLMAKAENIKPSNESVSLDHRHKLSLLNIVIQPGDGTSAAELLALNPVVSVSNVYTQCDYDFDAGSVSNLSNKQNITLHGNWSVSGGKLIGKSAILIPQSITKGTALLDMIIDGQNFTCRLDDDFDLLSKKKNTLTIPCSKNNVGGLKVSITDWEGGSGGTASMDLSDKGIVVSSLIFDKSNVYTVYDGNMAVAQICKEYLLSDNINTAAIVAYPISKNVTDLTKGTVLKLIGVDGNVNGGTVSWNKSTNKLTYIAGNQAAAQIVYMDNTYAFSFSKPANPLNLSAVLDVLTDVRGDETVKYPIVKIGTQYWMADNLATSKYTDGTSMITKGQLNQNESSPACLITIDTTPHSYFYNAVAVNSGKLIPSGWKMPNESEWNLLSDYIGGSVSKLKAGTWTSGSLSVLNSTGFNGYPIGYVSPGSVDKTVGVYLNKLYAAAYWRVSSLSQAEKGVVLWNASDSFIINPLHDGMDGYSIRCIKQ